MRSSPWMVLCFVAVSITPALVLAAPPAENETSPQTKQVTDALELVNSDDDADVERGGQTLADLSEAWIKNDPGNPRLPYAIFGTGKALYKLDQFEDAKPALEAAEQLFTQAYDDASMRAESQKYLAATLTKLGEHQLAVDKARAATATYQKLGDDEGVGEVAYALGESLFALGRVEQAEAAYRNYVDGKAKKYGKQSRDYAIAVGRLGMRLNEIHDYYRAAPFLKESMELRRQLGDVGRAGVMANHLADIYTRLGALDEAEVYRTAAVEFMEKERGRDAIEMIPVLDRLVGLHIDRNDAPSAKPHLERVEKLAARHTKPVEDLWVDVRIRRASFEMLSGRPQQAVDIYEDLIRRLDQSPNAELDDKRTALAGLANLYHAGARYDRARNAYVELLAAYTDAASKQTPNYATLLANLAGTEVMLAQYDAARRHLTEALDIARPIVGDDSELVDHIRWTRATVELRSGDPRAALPHLRDAEAALERRLRRVLAVGSEDRKRRYAAAVSREIDPLASLGLRIANDDPAAVEIAMLGVVRRKGRVLDAVGENLGQLASNLDAEGRRKLDELAAVRSALAELVVASGRADASELEAERRTLEARERALQEAIAKQSSKFKARSQPVDLGAIRAALPPKGALVEFIRYRTYDYGASNEFARRGDAHYGAFVVTADKLVAVDLGSAEAIDAAVRGLRGSLARRDSEDVRDRARNVDELVMQPLREHLAGLQHVVLAPDGELNLVPFAAFVGPDGKYLVEGRQFTYVSTARDLVSMQVGASPRAAPFIFADPNFSAKGGGAKRSSKGERSAELANATFPSLPGTRSEAEAIGKTIEGATIVTGDDATETRLKQLHGPVILHAATHGFFLDDQPPVADDSRGLVLAGPAGISEVEITREDPLLRSGLVAAGADALESGDDDGILTALEAASLDLAGTQLVVLSACETGLGDVQAGEGVYGLRRSLVLAGAESQVMSMWKVDDAATRDLMVRFYEDLAEREPRGEALREAQLALLADKKTAHPYYWAAFVPSGAWGPIDLEWTPTGSTGGETQVDRGEPDDERKPRRRRRSKGDLRRYWKDGFDGSLWHLGGAYTRPALPARYQGTDVTTDGGFVVEAIFFAIPHFQVGLDYQWDRWMAPDLPTDDDIWINRIELRLQTDIVPLQASRRVRPALHPRLGLGFATGKWDQTVGGSSRDRERFFGAGLTPGADAALYIRLGDKLVLGLRGGVAFPYYAMRADGERAPWDKDIGRSLVAMGGLSLGAIDAR